MKNLIRNILKEELNLGDRFLKMINNEGLLMVCRKVGGIKNVSKIVKMSEIDLLKKEFIGKEIDVRKLEFKIQVGGYDFTFKVREINDYDEDNFLEVNFDVLYGKVTLIMTTDKTYDLLSKEMQDFEEYWQIKNEVSEIVDEYFRRYFKEIKLNFFNGFSAELLNM
jgi:hypothetical protein